MELRLKARDAETHREPIILKIDPNVSPEQIKAQVEAIHGPHNRGPAEAQDVLSNLYNSIKEVLMPCHVPNLEAVILSTATDSEDDDDESDD